ncbi:hypothetical protein [Endothiovibrio diazotrophicus]
MDGVTIDGVVLTPLRRIAGEDGGVMHAMKRSQPGFHGFGEAYFSEVFRGAVKPWRCHRRMTMNLVVASGAVRFSLYDERDSSPTRGALQQVCLSPANYQRLTVPPGVWVSFRGEGEAPNLILNIADREHDDEEVVKRPLDTREIPFDWRSLEEVVDG